MPEKILGIGRWASLGNCYSVYSSWVREISIFPVSLSLLVGRGQNKPRISWLWKQSLHIVAFLDSSYSLHPLEAFQLLLLPTGAPETTHASHTNDCGNEIAIEYLLYSFRSTTGIYYFTTSVVSFLYFLFLLLNKGHFAFDPKKKKKKTSSDHIAFLHIQKTYQQYDIWFAHILIWVDFSDHCSRDR